MTHFKAALVTLILMSAAFAHAGTLNCTSVGENRLNMEVTLQTNFLGTEVKSGSYSYQSSTSDESGSGQFTCKEPNEKSVIFCEPSEADANITKIVAYHVFGFMIQQAGQGFITFFECE